MEYRSLRNEYVEWNEASKEGEKMETVGNIGEGWCINVVNIFSPKHKYVTGMAQPEKDTQTPNLKLQHAEIRKPHT